MTVVRALETAVSLRAPEAELAAFTYHDVTDDPSDSGFQRPAATRYKLSPIAFARQLDAIGAAGTPQLVTDVNLAIPGRHRLLTFDDGGRSMIGVADELARRGWRGHFFLVTRLIGTRRFVDASDVRYLRSCGHVVGSHSHTHPDIFRDQPRARMDEEWRVSSDILAQPLGERCTVASVPGGDISPEVLDSGAAAGFRYLFTSEPWLTPRHLAAGPCWVLGRYCPTTATSLAQVAALAAFRGWRAALFVRRIKALARAGFPMLYRHYVRVRTREFGAEVD
ncbi:MAG TPA: polysaccharide deacetylase family protein [Gemmatimonadales bacterium]|nr:polysaccharide deacetylase family protein [Gemmatimonadales bacterium]